ncbi:lipopolysaccharide transport system ATP-binding protein [Flexibacter flexilis DSM 6793]|uniref:Lipopolysaccharide transport system ATP-binding protein n=1 Tax=Flexibacter flexilis DSM 6793 TaxID=927664 RepID=A0A1I1DKX8_9BACT|nr:ABC transporter ATP-binding protein [Flexibacter flexilis]SFB75494.1 lipopolysaccharide transport system ATP-binding protein [Flexibacter flexilis DSM 6793]
MSNTVIRVEQVAKQYRLGEVGSGTLQEDFKRWWDKLRGNNTHDALTAADSREGELVWALQDINFEIKQGEAVGVVGRNGAGKSTLLKILSRVTAPTSGQIKVKGRIASLLEVGTGFHPDLTGRENIFLNGAILGMTKHEIRSKFDEIVAFSGVEKYIDTPVKRYSSGMYVRLAFAVAAHLEPEILIIDEVLAVGDSVFQQKCIDKMTDVCNSGRTILFVSHNMVSVQNLCTRGIFLAGGKLLADDNIGAIIDLYTNTNGSLQAASAEIDLTGIPRKGYAGHLRFRKISFPSNGFEFGEPIKFNIQLDTFDKDYAVDLDFGINIKDKNYANIIHCSNRFINKNFDHSSDNQIYSFEIANNLKPGIYLVTLFLRSRDVIQDWLQEILQIEIYEGNPYGYRDSYQIQGLTFPLFSIEQNEIPNM